MKILQRITLAVAVLCLCWTLAACNAPQTPDTSAVAGTYYQHDNEDQPILEKFIKLNSDGTWTNHDDNEVSGTFKIENNNEISLFIGSMKFIYGTIENDIMEVEAFLVSEKVTYYKASN